VIALVLCLLSLPLIVGASVASGQDLDGGPDVEEGIGTSPGVAVPATDLADTVRDTTAGAAEDSNEALLTLARDLYLEVMNGDIRRTVVAALALLIGIALLRRHVAWFNRLLYDSDWTGVLATLGVSTLGAGLTALAGGGELGWDLVKSSWLVGLTAAGGYSVLWRRLALPLLNLIPFLEPHIPDPPVQLPKARAVSRQ